MGVTKNIDLNADLAEECGDDAAMYQYLSSANICCGRHAGGLEAMEIAVQAAISHDVVLGAHVGYEDRENFGRNDVEISYDDLRASVTEQIQDLLKVIDRFGGKLKYVKPHGALYHRIGCDVTQAQAVVDAIVEIDPALHILIPDTEIIKAIASSAGLFYVHEFFADRAYLPVGTLAPRSEPNSVLHDNELVAARVLDWLTRGKIPSTDGSEVSVTAQSICLHGDTPGAIASAEAIFNRLTESGYQIKSWLG